MIAAGKCLNFFCLFVSNFVFVFIFLETANVFPLTSQLTMKINDFYVVLKSILYLSHFSGQGRLPVSRPMMLLFLSALIMHVSKNNLF